ncbi:hypothetical protein GCM10009798_43060 [Nocardioides panacihumi]|uniref:Uncharacterized protein n=1 Tax=Nocardioides panacihumi TaxID=400774 RepID=A0ABN2RYX4_9ACTN
MDLAALRKRLDRIPIVGHLLSEFVRIEFIDRCMLIAAQGLLALVPMLVVVAAFFPRLTDDALQELTSVTGLGSTGSSTVTSDLQPDQVRNQTGLVGAAITLFSATSFARAMERMYERVWQQPHIGGLSGTRRCFMWLIGWLLILQVLAALRSVLHGGSLVTDVFGLGVEMVMMSAIWWGTSWVLLFGRVGWLRLTTGAVLAGAVTVIYTHLSGLLMPAYVSANARQFGTLGIILSLSTWLIGLAAVLVGSALVGRVVTEDPTVLAMLRTVRGWVDVRGPRRPEGPPRRRPAGRS